MINHRPTFKVWINNFLRVVQFWTKNKYVIVSEFEQLYDDGIVKETLTGYGFRKIKHKTYLPSI